MPTTPTTMPTTATPSRVGVVPVEYAIALRAESAGTCPASSPVR